MKIILRLILVFSLLMTLTAVTACSPIQYELTTSVEPADSGTVSPGGTYDEGSNIRVTATPKEGYVFDHWSGDVSGSSTEQTISMNANKNVTAHFKIKEPEEKEPSPEPEPEPEPVYYSLSVTSEPAYAGSVTPSEGKFKEGSTVNLIATPQTGYAVKSWGGDVSGISNSVAVTMNEDKDITVYFELAPGTNPVKQYNLTMSVKPADGGIINPSTDKYNVHAKVILTAMPADGYEFHHWGGDISSSEATVSFNIDEDMSVVAYFEEAGDLTLSSPVFTDKGELPELYTCGGEDISPEISWSGVPFETKSFVLIMDDPDAPQATFVHWVVYNIPVDTRTLQENTPIVAELPDGSIQGINNFGDHGYGGPCLSQGQRHEYRFTLYAVDTMVVLSPWSATKNSVLAAIDGHILEQTRISVYFQN
ncbi:MAG: YbhB/YbcL family Raf kinase inhibitor-like protein [Dehalococcoidales bacterium]|nr:MAG: YbhB/YbcL family Raf kinase inhibitor-like protein [Dehalococcoidales bacterium]